MMKGKELKEYREARAKFKADIVKDVKQQSLMYDIWFILSLAIGTGIAFLIIG